MGEDLDEQFLALGGGGVFELADLVPLQDLRQGLRRGEEGVEARIGIASTSASTRLLSWFIARRNLWTVARKRVPWTSGSPPGEQFGGDGF